MFEVVVTVCVIGAPCFSFKTTDHFLTVAQCDIGGRIVFEKVIDSLSDEGIPAKVMYSCVKKGEEIEDKGEAT